MAKRKKSKRSICGTHSTKHAAEMDAIGLRRRMFVNSKSVRVRKKGARWRVCYKRSH